MTVLRCTQYSSIFINIHQYLSIFINILHSVHSVVSRKWLPLRILSHSLDGRRDRLSAACQVGLKTPNSPWNASEKRVYLHVCHENIGKMNENYVLLPWNIYITGVWCCPLVSSQTKSGTRSAPSAGRQKRGARRQPTSGWQSQWQPPRTFLKKNILK